MAELGRVDRLVRTGLRRGVVDGIFGGNATWMVLGAVALFLRVWRRHDPVVVTETLSPGQRIEIVHLPAPPSRRERRAAAGSR